MGGPIEGGAGVRGGGAKLLDYADFKKAVEIMKNKGHLTKEGLEEICKIKVGMNRGRL